MWHAACSSPSDMLLPRVLSLSAIGFVVAASALVACSGGADEDTATDDAKSVANHVDCDASLGALSMAHLQGIAIREPTALSISARERVRHLNELDALPRAMLDVYRARHLTISLTGGSVVNFPEFANLRGVTPRGWEGTEIGRAHV